MKRNAPGLVPAVLFAIAAILFGTCAAAVSEPAVKMLFLLAALCELAASIGFFCSYLKRRRSAAAAK